MNIFPIDDKPFSWKRLNPGSSIAISNVIAFRTFSLKDFLNITQSNNLIYHLTEHRYLYAKLPNCNIEIYILGQGLPKKPNLTLLSDEDGDLHWLMHEEHITIRDGFTLFRQKYLPEVIFQQLHKDGYWGTKLDIDEYNNCLNENNILFMDAFEGDSEIIWNID